MSSVVSTQAKENTRRSMQAIPNFGTDRNTPAYANLNPTPKA